MVLETPGIQKNTPIHEGVKTEGNVNLSSQKKPPVEQPVSDSYNLLTEEEIRAYINKLFKNLQPFNKRIKFTVNRELDQIVVKIIDSTTDKVIKEIPPAELQRLQVRIREVIGLLFDQKI
ncbi:MAG: hypothetical protein DRP87_19900 [Spirochaetes bacterium]|nr:MAG: hypothetical protein DRP87_19900 [Spirochaetota bacterium]